MKHIIFITALGLLFFSSVTVTAGADEHAPAIEVIKNEFHHRLPAMWKLNDLTITDSFTVPGSDPAVWKGKLQAVIETTDNTYLPTDYSLGAITIVRPVHQSGVQRTLFARAAARETQHGGWEIAFEFDNDVTLSAGLPLDYYFGEVVVEGSDEFKELGDERLTNHIDALIKEHSAHLAALRKTHAAEVQTLKDELQALDDVDALESELDQRINTLTQTVKALHKRLEKTTTQLYTDGIVINQWVSAVDNPFTDMPEGNKATIKQRDWERSRPDKLLGQPDSVRPCEQPSSFDNAWSPSHTSGRKWIEEVKVYFEEAVIPTEITVFEAGNHGFVRQLILHGEDPVKSKTVNVQDVLDECPGGSVFPIVGIDFPVNAVTVTIDADHTNENQRMTSEAIDAVRLTGVIKEDKGK